MLYQRTLPLLYRLVRLANSESGARLAVAIEQHPELAELIHEIRHKADGGSESSSGRHLKFYKMAAGLPNLETLILRTNPRPHKFNRFAVDNSLTAQWARQVAREVQTVKQFRNLGFGPPGQSQFSPPDTGMVPLGLERGDETLFGHALRQNPPGLSALHLRVLCITGAKFQQVDNASWPLRHTDTPLEDLTLLNCIIKDTELMDLLNIPQALKRFTFRGNRVMDSDDEPEPVYLWALFKHRDSLEYVDYDLYCGGHDYANFYGFTKLKHLTITISSLAGSECIELDPAVNELLPPSLESLTIRYDQVKSWVPSYIYGGLQNGWLPNLRLFTCEVANVFGRLRHGPPAGQVWQEINTWQSRFKKFNVELRTEIVQISMWVAKLPKYEVCACERLPFFHGMFRDPEARYKAIEGECGIFDERPYDVWPHPHDYDDVGDYITYLP
ncbi:uncharacterized protein N7515_004955 [Penicillium bovifimosum]|uniref:Uncharacterized protein n=1 Tax=Penicillium bovifimosum TaxID=126998 RepID=A0A9W9L4E7_9EURO|nr:uncharacterized protein N7515_004955 [Penicillium bovifimosum]KAJ5135677.1 hypothetical protein N7515_004955 [Penicillium bovifimosum]